MQINTQDPTLSIKVYKDGNPVVSLFPGNPSLVLVPLLQFLRIHYKINIKFI